MTKEQMEEGPGVGRQDAGPASQEEDPKGTTATAAVSAQLKIKMI